MPKTFVNGMNLYYEVHGKGEPLVLIAGFSCDSSFWKTILSGLEKHFHVLIFDNRGVGQSSCPGYDYTAEDMAEDTLQLIHKLDFGKPHLIGHSLGGAIAQVIAHGHPEKVSKVILSNTLIKLNKVSEAQQIFMKHARRNNAAIELLSEAIIPWLFSNDFLAKSANVDRFVKLQVKNLYPQSCDSFEHQLKALLDFDSTTWYKNILTPTLVIGGEDDILCPHDSKTLGHGIPKAKFINLPRLAHLPNVEKPAEYIKIVVDFLKNS